MIKPILKKEAKRFWIYSYGKDGEITVSKMIAPGTDVDYADLLDAGDVKIKNSSDCSATIDLCDHIVDLDALAALDKILSEL